MGKTIAILNLFNTQKYFKCNVYNNSICHFFNATVIFKVLNYSCFEYVISKCC